MYDITIQPAAIILAAGEGSRIGKPKALLELNGRYFLERIIDTLIISNIEQIIVVLGAGADEIQREVDLSMVNCVLNDNYEDGSFSSLQYGIDQTECASGLLVFPVDHPMVSHETVMNILQYASQTAKKRAVVPAKEGMDGFPVWIPREISRKLTEAAADFDLRSFIENNSNRVERIMVNDAGILTDIDTPEDYERLKQLCEGI
ncbi:MAG: NTP transferase domain-containing protein [candidate division Zixibacteria bacterium]|nr:NTP transferase domain-containing protein [candidate division Zixibacteria bacterium]